EVARQALDEVEDEPENDRVYSHVVRRMGQAYSLKTGEAWRLLTTHKWSPKDSVDGVIAEFKRYLRVLGVTSTVASEVLLKESLMASMPAEVRRAIEAFEEDGRELVLNDVVVKARTLLKHNAQTSDALAAASITSGKYCYACKTAGHTAAECGRARSHGSGQRRTNRPNDLKRVKCFACRQRGHMARDCPRRASERQSNVSGAAATNGNGPSRTGDTTLAGAASAESGFPLARRQVGGVPIEAAVDTGCDISLISIGFVKAQGWVMDDAGPSVSLTQMDGTGLLKTIGIIHLLVSFDESGTAQKKSVPHVFHVVPQTVLGAVVIGVDFAGRHLQGLRWNQAGKVQVGAAARVQSSDEGGDTLVNECRLPDLPGVHAHVYQSGKVVITADDFEVIREANDCHFTCRWIWRDGRGPSPMTMANRGDYNPSLTSEEEAQVTVEVEKMVSNGWPHKTTTPLRMCLDFRRLNRCLKSEPVRGIVNCPETLHRWRSVVHGYTLDVKKCYYAIHMAPCLYKYLCVLINQKVYCMKVLPFGLSVAPKVATAVISWLLRGIPYPISSFIDDIIIEDEGCGEREAAVEPESVRLVREALAKGNMYCKETCKIGESSRVLGLDLYREAGRLRWKRRADLDLEMDTSNPITRRELSAWCGRLIGHVPIAGWLRPCVAMLLRASSSGGWDSVVDESVVDLAACIYEKLQCEGDPASGIWFCPPSTSDEVVAWHIESDASGIAMGATLAYERQNGERVVVRDVSWLLDRRASLRHVNINELCAAAQALIWASPYVNGRVVLHVDNECVRAWVSRFLKGEAVKKGGLASTIVSRRLQCIYDIAEVLQSLEVRRVESESNGSDILTRVDEKFLAILSSMEGDRHDRHGINVEADIGGAATVAQPGVRLLDEDLTLNHGAIIDAQYDDEVYYKVRRALRSGRLVPESVPMDIQQVLPDISINDYDMLVREYYAPCKGLVVTVPVLPDTLKAEVVHGVHSLLCHSGFRRIVEVLSGLCWFPNILDETAAMLSNCDICSRQSRPMIVGHDVSIFSPDRLAGATPFSVVSADVVYLPAPYLSQQCAVSKYACLIKLDGEDAATIQQAFERSWEILGKRPVYLLTDNAAAFLACRLPNVTRLHTPARSSQSNGMIESLHRTVRRWMRAVLADDASMDVDAAVARVMRAYNTTCHSVTGRIPNDMFNADPAGVEWKRLVDHAVQLAEKKLISSTKHELYPGCIVRVRATTRFDKVVTNSNDTPFSERRWRVVGFPTSSGLITNAEDYGYFRKVKIVCDGEIK
ncbi:hypothetical protein FOL47_001427, partial [Perkinsus chesapeaki]